MMTEIDRDRNHKMMLDGNKWPSWPFLPVKRFNSSLKDNNLGVLLDQGRCQGSDGSRWTIYHVNLFDAPEDLTSAVKTEYKSVDEVIADGWMVD